MLIGFQHFFLCFLLKVFLLLAGWATGLSAGEGDWTLDYSFFTVSIELTDAGHGGFLLLYFF